MSMSWPRAVVVRAKASRTLAAAQASGADAAPAALHISSRVGDVVAVLSKSIAEPASMHLGGPACGQPVDLQDERPLADYWRSCGFPYTAAEAEGTRQVLVRFADGRELTYPADKVFRFAAKRFAASAGDAVECGGVMPWSNASVLKLRRAIVAAPGNVLLAADYSQVSCFA